ncbi:cytochrome P450 [Xylariomycetidae sp. FL0641]|nr:cytochrome P450 [Xylariomycetidae sp. FL0641]
MLHLYALLGLLGLVGAILVRRMLLPKPYPGIPYNAASARRISGDLPELAAAIRATGEVTESMRAVTARRLGVPVAQVLFPGTRRPLVVLDDAREAEDLVARRNREFDKAPASVDLMAALFPRGSLSQYTTPALRRQKREWADVMGAGFLRTAVAPNVHAAARELVAYWRLKAVNNNNNNNNNSTTSTHGDHQPFDCLEDLKNCMLDAVWVALIGDRPGILQYETRKLQRRLAGATGNRGEAEQEEDEKEEAPPPRGVFLREEVAYISDVVARGASAPLPRWFAWAETWTPRYRRFRAAVAGEVGAAMRRAVARFQRLGVRQLEADADRLDSCMLDLVLRRHVLEAKKAGRAPTDPTEDQSLLDETFVMLVGGHDSTSFALTWFIKLMEAFPSQQAELRRRLQEVFPGPELPSVDDILGTDFPYLDAACEEGLRLGGTVSGSLRQALVDTEILGHRIPKGAEILMTFWIHRESAVPDESTRSVSSRHAAEKKGDGLQGSAGRDLGVFEARRWLAVDEETGQEKFNPCALPSIIFGGGYRGCPGRKLATMQYRIFVVMLMLSFEFLELPPELRTLRGREKIFREPQKPYARIRVLD